MAGAVEGVNAQDMNTVTYHNTKRQYETVQVLSETITPLEKYNQLMTKIKKVGKTKEEREKITDPNELRTLYELQNPLYRELIKQYKIIKKEGKDISLLKKEIKRYATAWIELQVKIIEAEAKLWKAEAKLWKAEAKLWKAEAKLWKAEAKLWKAEARAKMTTDIVDRYKNIHGIASNEDKEAFAEIEKKYGKEAVRKKINEQKIVKNDIERILWKK